MSIGTSFARRIARRIAKGVQPRENAAPHIAAAHLQTRADAFELLYDRQATQSELELIDARQGPFRETGRRALRQVLFAIDKNTVQTPFQVRLTPQELQWVDVAGLQLALDCDDVAVSRHIAAGTYEPNLVSLFRRTLKPGMRVADIGANVGYYTAQAAALVGPLGRVYAFEPNSENARLILMTCARNGLDWIELHPVALGPRPGFVLFTTSLGSNGGQMPDQAAGLASPGCQVVPTQRLDTLVKDQIHLIKIDVEGAEPLVLDGSAELIARWRPVITAEFCPLMLSSISGRSPLAFLDRMSALDYRAALLNRSASAAEETPITDNAAFLADWGPDHRIEDLVFRPSSPIA